MDPGVDDLTQAPCSPGLGQGVCDLGQAFRVPDPGETVPFLGEADVGGVCGAGHELVAVEDDLGPERRMPAHLDGQMSPGRVHDVEGVVVDELPGLLQVLDATRSGGSPHLPHTRRDPCHQDQEDPDADRVVTEVVLGAPVFALAGGAVDHRHPVRPGPAADPAGEPAGQPDQMRVVQGVVTVVVPTAPPGAKPARVMPQRVIGVYHYPVHAVIAAGQQAGVPLAELIHPPTLRRSAARHQICPEGATAAGRSPGSGVAILGR